VVRYTHRNNGLHFIFPVKESVELPENGPMAIFDPNQPDSAQLNNVLGIRSTYFLIVL
jgi:hypothetical protein